MKRSKDTMMYVRWFFIRLAMMLFDIFAVNIAYFAALVIRFYVASEFNVWAVKYIPAFLQFAPFYTICCILVFFLFKLYNSMWKYAGLNDLNRIALASLVTCVIQVAGSNVFAMRMPVTYYLIGAVLQFAMIAISRFSYRFFLVERNRLFKRKNKGALRVMVVGVGETSRIVVKHLERDTDNGIHCVCLMDFRGNEFGDVLEGIPVVSGIDMILPSVKKYDVETVILADPVMPASVRSQIREICGKNEVKVQDYTSYFQDFRGVVTVRNVLEYARGPVELVMKGKRYIYTDSEQAMMSLSGKYVLNSVSARDNRLVIDMQKDVLIPNDVKEEWVRSYKEETGEDISFF